MSERTKFILDESQIPAQWYNVVPDLPAPPPPPLHPGTGQPVGPDDLAPLFPMALIGQEVTAEPYVDVPGEVIDVYKLWRPTPLFRARRLEKLLNTPARIYYKYEGVSPAGSHKPNTAVPQAYYNSVEGTKRLTTETGAGQWGSALAFATAQYGLDCEIWMVRASYDQKPHRRTMMQTWGATVHPSPSRATQSGLKVLADDPDSPAISNCATASCPITVWCRSTWLSTEPSAYRVSADPAAASTASEIAMPSDPGESGSSASTDSPAWVARDGDGCTVAPQVCIIVRRCGFWS